MKTVVEARNLTKWYPGAVKPAVRDVNLTVPERAIYGFIGPNGAGKTTTLRMLLGLVQPTQGDVRFWGQPLFAPGNPLLPSPVLPRLGTLIETPGAYSWLTGREYLWITGKVIGATRSAMRSGDEATFTDNRRLAKRIQEILCQVGLLDAADRQTRQYSLGMKARLSLAAALIHQPELLILDEPSNGLDPSGIREMRDLIRQMPGQGVTVLVSSHLLGEVEQFATHIGVILDGTLHFEGTLNEIRNHRLQDKNNGTDGNRPAIHLDDFFHALIKETK